MGLGEGARFGDLLVERRIGRGGMGEVYLVRHEGLDRLEALKVLRDDPDTDLVSRFRAEARIGGRLHHPRIVTVYDLVDVDGRLGLRMEYVEGHDLRTALREKGPLDPRAVSLVITDVADALDAAHRAGVLHRDVKPANVLLPTGAHGRHAVLGDFGIGLLEGAARLTTVGFLGTPAYTAPERLVSGEATTATDVYSLGCTTFEALTGVPPYQADSQLAVVQAHVEAPPPSPREHVRNLPARIDQLFADTLAKDPARRPASAAAFARALAHVLGPDLGGDDGIDDGSAAADEAAELHRTRRLTSVTSQLPANRPPSGGTAATDAVPAPRAHSSATARPAGTESGEPAAAGVLLVQVSPLRVEVAPGQAESVDVRVHNQDQVPHDAEVRVHPSPGCGIASGLSTTVSVPADGFTDVQLPVQVPRSSDSRPGAHPYHVTVKERGADSSADRCVGHVAVGVYDEVAVELSPSEAITRGWGEPVAGRLVLANLGNRPAVVDAVVHHGVGLLPVLAPVRETLRPGQAVAYPLRLGPENTFLLGGEVRHRLWVDATSDAGVQASAAAALIQRGRVPAWVLLGLLVAAVLIAVVATGATGR